MLDRYLLRINFCAKSYGGMSKTNILNNIGALSFRNTQRIGQMRFPYMKQKLTKQCLDKPCNQPGTWFIIIYQVGWIMSKYPLSLKLMEGSKTSAGVNNCEGEVMLIQQQGFLVG